MGTYGLDAPAASVGQYLEDHQLFSPEHAGYKAFELDVQEELKRLSEMRVARDAAARPLLLTSALEPEQEELLRSEYPDFSPVMVPMNSPVHAMWAASRRAANELLAKVTEPLATSVVHYGGSLLHALIRKARGTHIESDPWCEVSTHERHSIAVDCHRLFQDYARVQTQTGVPLPHAEYTDYLQDRAYRHCDKPHCCSVQASALCIDLSIAALSPMQVAASMLQHNASVAHGFFIYHPSMLVQSVGEFPGLGVHFEKTETDIKFRYPEGKAGVDAYSRSMWALWLRSHSFSIADGAHWFQLELLKNRGSFMFFRMVKLDAEPEAAQRMHALDLPEADDYVLVKSWKLKAGFRSDTKLASSWEPNNFVIRSRIQKRVLEFAMQLTPENFSRYAIRRQVCIVNNRWVVAGTTVTVVPPLELSQIEDLTTAIYARAFIDRYESSRLSTELMHNLKRMASFHDASFTDRLAAVTAASLAQLYQSTVGKFEAVMRGFLDSIVTFLSGARTSLPIGIKQAPSYVLLSSGNHGLRAALTKHYEAFDSIDSHGFVAPIQPTGMGASLADLFRRYTRRTSVSGAIARRDKFLLSNPVLEKAKAGTSTKATIAGAVHAGKFGVGKSATASLRTHVATPPSVRVDIARRDEGLDLDSVIRVVTDWESVYLGVDNPVYSDFTDRVAATNALDSVPSVRHEVVVGQVQKRHEEAVQRFKVADDADPVASLNQLYLESFPAVANQKLQFDTFSLSLDPQDRVLMASYLRMNTYGGLPPSPRQYYESKLNALNVPKRQNTAPELLSALQARNLNAPQLAQPQEEPIIIREIFEVFLRDMCVADAREKLMGFQMDPVALSKEALDDWASKANPATLERVKKDLTERSKSLADMPVDEYLVMLKADVKPTMSNKPVAELTAPQTIVYHDKALSGLYSSIFRVLVMRFLSILKPTVMVNLRKDTARIGQFISECHPFDGRTNRFLENDFGKYDKSQSRFAFSLEHYVFTQLGMNAEFLDYWLKGHVECSLRSVSLGLSLNVMYQRKSGDATTAFGNVILNILSVAFAYQGTEIAWAVFMGDDSLVCARTVIADDRSVQILAEIFNLGAKFYITDAPYFASHFVILNHNDLKVDMMPDPIKRIEKLSMHISADDPQWMERHQSFRDTMRVYNDEATFTHLARAVTQRYEVSEGLVCGAAKALGTLMRNSESFRNLWSEQPVLVQA